MVSVSLPSRVPRPPTRQTACVTVMAAPYRRLTAMGSIVVFLPEFGQNISISVPIRGVWPEQRRAERFGRPGGVPGANHPPGAPRGRTVDRGSVVVPGRAAGDVRSPPPSGASAPGAGERGDLRTAAAGTRPSALRGARVHPAAAAPH